MRIKSIVLWHQLCAFTFLILTTSVFQELPGGVYGFLLSHNARSNFRSQSGYLDHMDIFHSRRPILVHSLRCDKNTDNIAEPQQVFQSRNRFFRNFQNGALALIIAQIDSVAEVKAFEGGVGGLGKTKPVTGVEFFDESSSPIQNDKGIVSSEIKGTDGAPILVSFQTPWPLLPTSGALEARDIRSTESAFVQVVPLSLIGSSQKWREKKQFQNLLMDSVFAAKGKFGAYGQPYDIQLKKVSDIPNSIDMDDSQPSIFTVTFTTLTPAMRESERKAMIVARKVGAGTIVLLVVTTTSARYSSNEKTFKTVASSFEAISAPQSSLKRRSSIEKQ
mmetsp:Transcript_26939/g.63270  ORF Transcript_26939/g.63270 Transcript_26939/m.63270 type:complete len:333 (-) Transcript_26939:113-1111(-)